MNRRELRAYRDQMRADLDEIGKWLDANPHRTATNETEYERIKALAEDVERRMDADIAERPDDYLLWSRNPIKRSWQKWRAFA